MRVARIYSLNAEDFENQDTLLLLHTPPFSPLQSSHHMPSILSVSLMETPHSQTDGLVCLSDFNHIKNNHVISSATVKVIDFGFAQS